MQNIIFTDGSSRGNPGRGGWGVVVVSLRSLSTSLDFAPSTGSTDSTSSPKSGSPQESSGQDRDKSFEINNLKEVVELGGREENTTNNRMELTAAINGLAETEAGSVCVVHTDSSYLINGITKWVFAWQRNDWKTKTEKDVSNKDLWMQLIELNNERKVSYQYIGGHVGIVGNERCDVIATSFADNKKIDLYRGTLSEYPIKNIGDVSQNLEKSNSKKIMKSRANTKAYSYISSVGGVIEKHSTWADCEKRVKGAKGARYKKALNREEEVELRCNLSTEVAPQ